MIVRSSGKQMEKQHAGAEPDLQIGLRPEIHAA